MRTCTGGPKCTHPNPLYFFAVKEHGRDAPLADVPSRWCRYCGAVFVHKRRRNWTRSVRRYWVRVRA